MIAGFSRPPRFPQESGVLREEIRAFLAAELADLPNRDRIRSWSGFDPEFSRRLGARGWIGMTWPKSYGGQERSGLERYVVLEELLAAGAPVAAHWIADRQTGPLILAFGSERQKQEILPAMAAGERFSCIGMSEPDAGSDLAAVRTRAVARDGGYIVNGAKLWTTNAHRAHYMVLFCRTGEGERRDGMSQFLVDLGLPGISISTIGDMAGGRHFNEVTFNDLILPRDALIGREGQGWAQVMSELALERSGPERFLSTFPLLLELLRRTGTEPDAGDAAGIGRMIARLIPLRHLSLSVAAMIEAGEAPDVQAALVKDLGSTFEQAVPEAARAIVADEMSLDAEDDFSAMLAFATLSSPAFSLRGGSREILRGIVARALGLR